MATPGNVLATNNIKKRHLQSNTSLQRRFPDGGGGNNPPPPGGGASKGIPPPELELALPRRSVLSLFAAEFAGDLLRPGI
jgi:hypothetical protein